MTTLERLSPHHARALLAFERENREYFARFVSDRGDAYFAEFADRHRALLAEQEAGLCHFHLLLDDRGEVIGRVNLVDVRAGDAELGYRIGERATGRGVATAAVGEICGRAAEEYGLTTLTALVALDNPASRAVLLRNGFAAVEDAPVAGRPGMRYRRPLAAGR
ncbi:GNAT family N-acetyltransferase [Streptomyces nodosus]|uniref:GCN5 family acetyltransferase n=1 Tax=Streptomyces nodosus TaxID=40318 RepID=A0A0B5DHS4_9ACTN|nr:GNAT family N-acetyltransferase [Streptomyces nodosus]AJE43243.1 GCN5 family acetyltransferase [Streptomyces nodosus]MBB4794668.1 ribosomal-protein-alanine N-acetyltransferase [Streptomyces nodosus]QEV41743.1 N-acetyltransferase [Streptomyces nodosus]